MGVVRRQSIKILFIFGGGVLIGYFNLLWLYPYCLNTEEIGLIRLLTSAGKLLSIFIPLGAQKIFIKYFPYFREKEKEHRGFLQLMLLYTLTGALTVVLLLLLFKDLLVKAYETSSELFVEYYPYVILLSVVIAFRSVFFFYSRTLMKSVFPNFLRQVMVRVLVAGAVLIYFFEVVGLDGMVQGVVGAYFIPLLGIAIYCRIHDRWGSWWNPSGKLPLPRLGEFFKFGSFMMLTSAGGLLLQTIDELLIGSYLGIEKAGIYGIAFTLGSMIELPKRALLQPSEPLVSKARKKGDLREVKELYEKSSINQLLVGGVIFLLVWTNLDQIFDLMPKEKGDIFKEGKMVVLYIMLSRLMIILFGLSGSIIMTSNGYRFNFYSMIAIIPITVGLNMTLIPNYGMDGAAFATLIASFCLGFGRGTFIWFKDRIHPFTKELVLTALLLSMVFGIIEFIPLAGPAFMEIVLRSGIILLLTVSGAYFLNVSKEANELLDRHLFNK